MATAESKIAGAAVALIVMCGALIGCGDPYRNNPNWYEARCPHCGWHGYWQMAGLRQYDGRAKCSRCKQVFQAYEAGRGQPQASPTAPQRQSLAGRAASALDTEMRQNYHKFYQHCGFSEDLSFAQLALDEVIWYRMRDAEKMKFMENTFYHAREAVRRVGGSGQPYFHLVSTEGKVMARGVIINGQQMPNLVPPEHWAPESLRRALPPGG